MKNFKDFLKENLAENGHVIGFLDADDCDSFNEFWSGLKDLLKAYEYYEGKDYEIEDDSSSTSSYDYDDEGTCHAIYLRFNNPSVTAKTFAKNYNFTDIMEIEDCTDLY